MLTRICLTSPEQHPTSAMPKALRDLHYTKRGDSLLSLISNNGCPNHGCEHTLTVWGERVEVVAWLDLFLETYPDTKNEIMMIKERIRVAVLHGNYKTNSFNEFVVWLKREQRQFLIGTKMELKPWFWVPDYPEAV